MMEEVLRTANQKNIPIFKVHFDFREGSKPPETAPELAQYEDANWTEIYKPFADAFQGTDLDQKLREEGITNLILMGFNQSACVRATVKTAINLGYSVETSFDLMQGWENNDCAYLYKAVDEFTEMHCLDENKNPISSELGLEQDSIFYFNNTHLVPYEDLSIFKLK